MFSKKPKYHCIACQKKFRENEVVWIKNLGPSLIRIVKQKIDTFDPEGFICSQDLRSMRIELIHTLFEQTEETSALLENILLSDDYPFSFNQEYQGILTIGERLSQKMTPFIGSWAFVLIFVLFIVFWVSYNSQTEIKEHFDPFPFVLLNLFLSCMAAIQAPIIMMAQNRFAKRERLRADEDYYTNLRGELELKKLHAKLNEVLKNHKKS